MLASLGGARAPVLLLAAAVAWSVTGAPWPALAAPPVPAELDDSEKADVERVETYLSGVQTMQGRFLQTTSEGRYSEGAIYLSRPGRMRIDYDPPVPIEIVATGRIIVYHDRTLEQVSYLGLDSTPASILLAESVQLSGGLTIVGFERGPGVVAVTLVNTDDPGEGSITLVFGDRPLELRKWVIVDAQGVTTTVSLLGARFGMDIDPALFEFDDPYFGRDLN